ncbi:hypothetical protein M408DRAFT_325879 [Serendipita vermifera MAFF 305830]|uniref:Uncharacterized protein n=1 Tax=Serendipita vermifera MAFF 305830 TaxID=933852 RepID=A0A0C3BCD2_SERVB|nr:hypothetical protein M408DRAFT_325879 [Serendipita vermifera MAFF 305830]
MVLSTLCNGNVQRTLAAIGGSSAKDLQAGTNRPPIHGTPGIERICKPSHSCLGAEALPLFSAMSHQHNEGLRQTVSIRAWVHLSVRQVSDWARIACVGRTRHPSYLLSLGE